MPLSSSQIEESFVIADEDIKTLLSGILNLNIQFEWNEKIIINAINKLLTVSRTRLQGLEYLNLLLDNCSSNTVGENALTWLNYCMIKYPGDNLKDIKLSTIGKVVEIAHKHQDFDKKFLSDYMSKILEICLYTHVNPSETEAALNTLTLCLKRYPSWFSTHKSKIEGLVLNILECSEETLVEKAAVAFLYAQQIGSAGLDGINHITNFSSSFQKLCCTVQKLFDQFFKNETEIDTFDTADQDGFGFKDVPYESQKMLHVLARRIRNCLKFIAVMMLKGFPVVKDVRPVEILNIISRGTAIHHCLTSEIDKTLEDFQFSLLLKNIQVQLLQLLKVFIFWFQTNALPFSFTISKILTDCLSRSQNCKCFSDNCIYQEVVYKILCYWIRLSRGSLQSHFQNKLVSCILKSITPVKNQVTLSLNSDSGAKHKSKKAKRRAIEERIIKSGQESGTVNVTAAEKFNLEKNCTFALETLKDLLTTTPLNVETKILQDMYSVVISTLVEITTSKFSHPYTDENCQAALYLVLVAFYDQDNLQVVPPLQLTLDLLNKGVNNRNRTISLACEHGLSNLEKLCQPVCASLYLPESLVIVEQPGKQQEQVFNNEVFKNLPESGDEEEIIIVDLAEETSLNKQPSVNILDVQIIIPSINEPLEPGRITTRDDSLPDMIINGPDVKNGSQQEMVEGAFSEGLDFKQAVKKEDFITSDADISNKEIKRSVSPIMEESLLTVPEEDVTSEPPMKKSKFEGEAIVTKNEEFITAEANIDDLENSFVDEIKDY